jgi:hypothetical protein
MEYADTGTVVVRATTERTVGMNRIVMMRSVKAGWK